MVDALEVTKRTALGKSSVKKLRSEGLVPAVVYGKGKETTPVQLDEEMLNKYLETGGRVADIVLEGEKLKAVVKDVQHDIFTDAILHLDFQLVSLTEKIVLPVSIILTGELQFPPDKGSLEQLLTEIEVECLPKDTPEEIKIDISALEPGDSVHVSDIKLPSAVTMVTSGEEALATVRRPTLEEEEPPAEGVEEATEPEVIGEHKKEEEAPQ